KLKRTLVPLLPAYHSKKQAKAENNGFCVRKALNLALLLANSGPPVRISPRISHIVSTGGGALGACTQAPPRSVRAHRGQRSVRGRRERCTDIRPAPCGP
ncbi:hypothetical protein ACPV3A_37840, partial [Paenibacillus sp. Dod16]|uniref:hypothetical protein n=1 Tax=Paenibacillus sp. Dod16 TaxID=3416392 RepID=UPI003CE7B617